MIVMKFGGSSLGTAAAISQVADIIKARVDRQPVLVVSALHGVTDQLVRMTETRTAEAWAHRNHLDALRQRHFEALDALSEDVGAREELEALFREVDHRAWWPNRTRDETAEFHKADIVACGERLSACIAAAALRAAGLAAQAVDARKMIVTDGRALDAGVRFSDTDARVREMLAPFLAEGVIPVVTGFIAATEGGQTTLLGRGGSDYTATIIAAAMKAEEVILWKEVDGIMTADPRVVPVAAVLDVVSYAEARELAYYGAKILHPLAIAPVERRGIPVRIRNTFRPGAEGTRILNGCAPAPAGVRAVAAIRDLSMVAVSGSGMAGIAGFSAGIFGVAGDAKVNLVMFGQSSSEQEIWFLAKRAEGERLVEAVKRKLTDEMQTCAVDRVENDGPFAAVAIVGDGMAGVPGTFARAATALAEDEINIIAAAQGSSERNISFVVRDEDADSAVRALHRAFELSQQRSKS